MEDEAQILPEWPEVPEHFRPKTLPHEGQFDAGAEEVLRVRGWEPVDVRFIDGPQAVALRLEGAILGTIQVDRNQMGNLELAAKIYGLTSTRGARLEDSKGLKKETVDDILGFFEDAAEKNNVKLPEKPKKNKGGRPKGALDTVPRPLKKDLDRITKIAENALRKEVDNGL